MIDADKIRKHYQHALTPGIGAGGHLADIFALCDEVERLQAILRGDADCSNCKNFASQTVFVCGACDDIYENGNWEAAR